MKKLTITIQPGDTLHELASLLREDSGLRYDGEPVELVFTDRQETGEPSEEVTDDDEPKEPQTELEWREMYVKLLRQAQWHGIKMEWFNGSLWSRSFDVWAIGNASDACWWRVRVRGAYRPTSNERSGRESCRELLLAAQEQGGSLSLYYKRKWISNKYMVVSEPPHLYRIVGKKEEDQ